MKKIFVLDTSALIDNPHAYDTFDNAEIIIPIAVLNELDNLKKQMNEAGKNARVATRTLDEKTSGDVDVVKGIKLSNNSVLKIDAKYRDLRGEEYAGLGDPTYGDTQILACVLEYSKHPETTTVLISNDINLRMKAKSRGVAAQTLEIGDATTEDIYSGVLEIECEEAVQSLYENKFFNPKDYEIPLYPNEFVEFYDEAGHYISSGRRVSVNEVREIKKHNAFSISPRNREQELALDILMDRKIDLCTIVGCAGTGKTLVALAACLEQVINKRAYDKLIVYRPIQVVGNDIGYLPGPQPLDAKVLTPNGWSNMGNIQPNDYIIGSDGRAKKVLKIFPKGEKEVFKVLFSDGSSTECCDDHLWHTTTLKESQRKDGLGSIKSLKEIKETLKAYSTKINNHKIPMIQPVSFEEKETIIDPYIMGILLGDGTLSEKYSVYFTSSDAEIQEHCNQVLPNDMLCKIKNKVGNSFNYSFIMKENENRLHRNSNTFVKEIKKYELFGLKSRTKFIPTDYKINSINKRLSLLQGLMDSDGFVSSDGSDVSYSTTSDKMAQDVQFIVQSLGGIAKINNKKSNYLKGAESVTIESKVVSISLPKNICPFRLSRKVDRFKSRKYDLSRFITDIVSVGIKETKCILVESEDHLYATDDFILTHNTMEEKLGPHFTAIMDSFEVLFSASPRKQGEWRKELEMFQKKGQIELEAITFIRGRSISNAIILVDEVQNLRKEDIKTILTRAGQGTKIILTGDIEQIDDRNLDALNNGLSYVIEKFKKSDLAGHITLIDGERSRLATEAAKLL